MSIAKVIFGLVCIAIALALAIFAWVSLVWGEAWFKPVPIALAVASVAVGVLFIHKRRKPMSRSLKFFAWAVLIAVVLGPVVLVAHIHHNRALLQSRAIAFLARPIPAALLPSGNYTGRGFAGLADVDAQNLGHSRELIERYATKGRIRWSARIQAQFATTPEQPWFLGAEDLQRTNPAAHAYLLERNAILAEEWRMGF